MEEDNRVVIEQMDDNLYHLYNEAGQAVETDFETYEEAEQWAQCNGYTVVQLFGKL